MTRNDTISTANKTITLFIYHVLTLQSSTVSLFFFFFNDTATTEIYTLSLHDALPIWYPSRNRKVIETASAPTTRIMTGCARRSEEHTSELQSRRDLVCRLLLEKKKNKTKQMVPLVYDASEPRGDIRVGCAHRWLAVQR